MSLFDKTWKYTLIEVKEQFKKSDDNKPLFGQYKDNKHNCITFFLLIKIDDSDKCMVINVNGLSWTESIDRFYTTYDPPNDVKQLFLEGFYGQSPKSHFYEYN